MYLMGRQFIQLLRMNFSMGLQIRIGASSALSLMTRALAAQQPTSSLMRLGCREDDASEKRQFEIRNPEKASVVIENSSARMANASMEDIVQFYSETLARLLNCALSSAFLMIKRNSKILTASPESLERTVNIVRSYFPTKVLCQHPELLSPSDLYLLEHRIQILKEIGFTSVSVEHLKNHSFRVILSCTQDQLKMRTLLPDDANATTLLLKCLDCPEDVLHQIQSSLPTNHEECLSITALREIILSGYILWKLQLNKKEGGYHQMRLKQTSVKFLVKILRILMEECGFAASQIQSYKSLLSLTPHHLKYFLSMVPMLAEKDIWEVALHYPSILFLDPQDVIRTEQILRNYKLSSDQIFACPSVFKLKPNQVHHKLQFLSEIKGYDIWSKLARFLYLLTCISSVQEIAKILQSTSDVTVMHNILLSLDGGTPVKREHDDRWKSNKVVFRTLCTMLDKSVSEVEENIRQHPKACTLHMDNAKSVLELLFDLGVTKEQVWNGLPVILYDRDMVKMQLDMLAKSEQADWKNHPNFLQLVIYYLEKKCAFTGEAVFLTESCKTGIGESR